MFFCVAEGHVEDGDLEEASVASEGDPIRSASKLDGQRSRTLNDSEACACCAYDYLWCTGGHARSNHFPRLEFFGIGSISKTWII